MNMSETSLHYIYILSVWQKGSGAIVAGKISLTNTLFVPCPSTFRTRLRYVSDEFDVYLVAELYHILIELYLCMYVVCLFLAKDICSK